MSGEYTENLDKLKKIFDEISETDLKTTKTYQEFLLKLHTAIKHQYVSFSKTRKVAEDNWKSLKEQLSLWEKTFERILLEKEEFAVQLESMRTLLDEKIYALTTKEDELESLLAENKSKEEEIEQLRKDVDELKKQIDELKLRGVDSGSVGEIERISSVDTEENEENKLLIISLEENLSKVEKENEELKRKYEEAINSHNSLQEELEKTQKELAEVLQQKDKKIDLIQLELEEKLKENLQLKTLLEQSNPEEQVKSLNEELEKHRGTISELEKQLANSIGKNEYEQVKQELEKIQAEFKSLEKEYRGIQEELSVKNQLVKEKELQVEELKEKLNNAPKNEELESLRRKLEEKDAEISVLKEIKGEYDNLKLRYGKLHTDYSQLENENRELLSSKQALEEKINILPTLEEWSNLQQEVINKKDEINKLKEEIEKEKKKEESLLKEKEELETGISSLEEKLISLEAEVVDLQKLLSEAPDKENYEKMESVLKSVKQENESLKTEIRKLSMEKQEQNNVRQTLEKEVEELKEKLKNAPKIENMRTLEKQLSTATTENKKLEQKMEQLMQLKSLASLDDINQIKEIIKTTFESIEKIEESIRTGISEQQKVINATTSILKKKRKPNLGEILLAAGIIDEHQLEEALNIQKQTPMKHLGDILVELGFVSEYAVAQSLACQCDVPFSILTEKDISPEAINAVPPRIMRQHNCIPMRVTERTLTVAITNPIDLVAIEDLEHASGKRVEVVVSTPTDIKNLLEKLVPVN